MLRTERSRALLDAYQDVVTGGVHSNFRSPVYFQRAKGSTLWDVDGNEYIDCTVNNGACILGHADPDVDRAVIDVMKSGLTVGLESELSLTAARRLQEMVPSAEQVRFANTGTEAVMKALMLARAFTGHEKIVKVEGGYHGWFDEAQVSVHPDPAQAGPADTPRPVLGGQGIRGNTLDSVVVVPFNNLEALERTLSEHRGQVACLILEPVMFNCGCICPEPGYLEELRRITKAHDIILIFDEIITGFRLAPGGAQERFGIVPDMSVFAKAIANGYPLSAVVGRRDLMELGKPGGRVLYGGTYNGQQAAVAAAAATLEKLKDGKVQQHLGSLTERLAEAFEKRADAHGIPARLEQCGGQFQVYFTEGMIKDYRSAVGSDRARYAAFHRGVVEKGVWMKGSHLFHHGVAYAHDEGDFQRIVDAFENGLVAVKEAGHGS